MERIFRKKEEAKEQVFSIEDAESFLSKIFDEKFQSLKEDVDKIYQEMQSVAANMRESLKILADATFSGPVDSELLQNVIAHRKSFIHKMKIMIEQIKRPMQSNFDSILEFNRSISSSISETDSRTVKDYIFLKELFEKEAKSSIEDFKRLSKLLRDFENLINNNKEVILSIRNFQNGLQSIKEERNILNQAEEHLKNLDARLSNVSSNYENVKEDLEKFKSGEEWTHFNELLNKKKSIEEDISSLKSQILRDISRIERPLKKFKNLVDNKIVKIDNAKVLGKYVNSTLDALIEEKNPEAIKSILEMVQDKISDGKIELKDKEKSLDEIRWVIENNIFENFLDDYISLVSDLEKLDKNISEQKAPSMKTDMENRIKDLERQVETTKMEIDEFKKQIEKLKNSISEKKNALEKSLSLLINRKISIMI